MQVTRGLIATLLIAAAGATFAGTEDMGWRECTTHDNARFCLKREDLLSTACCDTTVICANTPDDCSAACTWAESQSTLCITKENRVTNRFLLEFLQPYNEGKAGGKDKCPEAEFAEVTVTKTGKGGIKHFMGNKEDGWLMKVDDKKFPPTDGKNYKCKFAVNADPTKFALDGDGSGYLYFAAEQYCFSRWVKVFVQPRTGYYDFNSQYQTNNPDEMSKVFASKFGTRYLVPAEYEVFIEFSPDKEDDNLNEKGKELCNEGKQGSLKLWAYHVTDAQAYQLSVSTTKPYAEVVNATNQTKDATLSDLIVYTKRYVRLANGEGYEPAQPNDPDATDEELLEENPNADKLPDQPVSSEGESPAWYATIYSEDVLFTLAGVEVTKEQAFWASFGTLIIILISVAVCLAISYWKRKRIAQEARRASNYIRRSTATLRASIRRARGKPTPEEEAKPMTDSEIKKAANAGGETKQEKALLQDMMQAQNEENKENQDNEGGSMELQNFSSNSNKVMALNN